jgi:hypothetical protein
VADATVAAGDEHGSGVVVTHGPRR